MNDVDCFIVRRLSDGSRDPSFGNGGVVSITNIEIGYSGDDHTGGFWLEDDGRMLVCGRSGVVPGNGDDAIVMAFYPTAVGIQDAQAAPHLSVCPTPPRTG